jgi:hypothetical protein
MAASNASISLEFMAAPHLALDEITNQMVDILVALTPDGVPVHIVSSVRTILNLCSQNQRTEQGLCRKLPVVAVLILTDQSNITVDSLYCLCESLNIRAGNQFNRYSNYISPLVLGVIGQSGGRSTRHPNV